MHRQTMLLLLLLRHHQISQFSDAQICNHSDFSRGPSPYGVVEYVESVFVDDIGMKDMHPLQSKKQLSFQSPLDKIMLGI